MTYEFTLLLVLAMFATSMVQAASNRRPFKSNRSPRETIEAYELVYPVRTYADSNQPHPLEQHILVKTQADEYNIVLKMNEKLVPSSFKSRSHDEQGREVVTQGHENCFYRGSVEGHPHWKATMSTCHGLRGSFGDPFDKDLQFQLEPMDPNDIALETPHVLYKESDYGTAHSQETLRCGNDETHDVHDMEIPNLDELKTKKAFTQQASGHWTVELIIVNDYRQFLVFDKNLSSTVMHTLEMANHLDQLYAVLNVSIALVEIITWTKGDIFTPVPESWPMISSVEEYGLTISTPRDSLMLITGLWLDATVGGRASLGPVCHNKFSVTYVVGGGGDVRRLAMIAAHELAHLFRIDHDPTNNICDCDDPVLQCIMHYEAGPIATQWSDCSVYEFAKVFGSHRYDMCLGNQPSHTVGQPECGNGILEGNEVCDCGTPSECIDPCCDASTCQLVAGVDCSPSQGPCCTDQCQIASASDSIICRHPISNCDYVELCTGNSVGCPEDQHYLDGGVCVDKVGLSSYCYSGDCSTHESQCQATWGTSNADEFWYSAANEIGDDMGNCAANNLSSFIPCAPADVKCGLLLCQTGGEFQLLERKADHYLYTGVLYTANPKSYCQSYMLYKDDNIPHPGYVKDGTPCGQDLACLNQHCVPASSLIKSDCPIGPNGQQCSGNGVCDSGSGHCLCAVGYSGTACENHTG